MGGGVHWAEWIMPIVGAHHLAVNTALNAAGEGNKRIATPDTGLSKQRDAQALAEQERQQDARKAQEAKTLAEQNRVAALPINVRTRAERTARSLGESGKRPSASQYLAG